MNVGIIGRASLYFAIPFCASLSKQLIPFTKEHTYPYSLEWVVIILVALIPSFVALRAYYDGSVEKLKQEQKQNEKTNS